MEGFILAMKLPKKLEEKRKDQQSKRLPPVYDREGLYLSEQNRIALENEGRKPHWRFRLENKEVSWDDLVRGHICYRKIHVSDPILIREDGSVGYTLANVVDDITMKISHILRGEDHVTNTVVHIQLFEALKAPIPLFAHFPLIIDAAGKGFSKRLGSLSISELRAQGILPFAILGPLMTLGTAAFGSFIPESLSDLSLHFDFHAYGKANPKLDIEELWNMNHKLLSKLSFDKFSQIHGIPSISPKLWEIIRENIRSLNEITLWKKICEQSISTPKEDIDFLKSAAEILPSPPWDKNTWDSWIKSIQQATGRKGKNLFHPLRLALTGKEKGPKMKELFPLIMPSLVYERLKNF